MKKKRIAGLAVLMPLCLLAACGGGGPNTLAISANWYANTVTARIDYSEETLTYDVTFTPPSVQNEYYVIYQTGTYTTSLKTENCTYGEGENAKSENVYHYSTRLTISGTYTYRGVTSEPFTDEVVSDVWFRTAADNLRPIKSQKYVHSTNPLGTPSETELFGTVAFDYSVVYDTATMKSATVTFTDRSTEGQEPATTTVELNYDGSVLDNEQILFALRGLDMSKAVTFATIDPQTTTMAKVMFSETPAKTTITPASLEIEGRGAVTEPIAAYTVNFRYDIERPGPVRTAIYAAQTSPDENLFRNVLLRLEDPIPSGYGTLVYTLKKATFAQ